MGESEQQALLPGAWPKSESGENAHGLIKPASVVAIECLSLQAYIGLNSTGSETVMSTTPSERAFEAFLKRLETDTAVPHVLREALRRDIAEQDDQLGATNEALSGGVENATRSS